MLFSDFNFFKSFIQEELDTTYKHASIKSERGLRPNLIRWPPQSYSIPSANTHILTNCINKDPWKLLHGENTV